MEQSQPQEVDESVVGRFASVQLKHFTACDPRCRGVQLPEGILLRYTLSHSLYFYLRSTVKDGNIVTRLFASDSPYDWQKTCIGEVRTPMLEPQAESRHLKRVQCQLASWVDFVRDEREPGESFRAFAAEGSPLMGGNLDG